MIGRDLDLSPSTVEKRWDFFNAYFVWSYGVLIAMAVRTYLDGGHGAAPPRPPRRQAPPRQSPGSPFQPHPAPNDAG